jgi:hypothetical protein
MLQPAHTIRQRPTIVECLQLTTKRLQLLNAPLRVSFSPGERMQEAKTTPYNQLPAFQRSSALCGKSWPLCQHRGNQCLLCRHWSEASSLLALAGGRP